MARDFRPKAARGPRKGAEDGSVNGHQPKGATTKAQEHTEHGLNADSGASSDGSGEVDSDDDEALLREIKALGGDESDLKLIRQGASKDEAEDSNDPSLQSDLIAFVKGLDYKSAGTSAPLLDMTAAQSSKKADKARATAEKAAAKEAEAKARAVRKEEERLKAEKSRLHEKEAKTAPAPSSQRQIDPVQVKGARATFLFHPTPQWSEAQLPALPSAPSTSSPMSTAPPAANIVKRLQLRAEALLTNEQAVYKEQMHGGRSVVSGMLSASDARFISQLLAPGARGGTLSDRIAALTLLAQSSPLHNLEAMETLLSMAQKKGREESSRATRALADWLASGGGLSKSKLRYFPDHPSVRHIAAIDKNNVALDSKSQKMIEVHLLAAAFEDRLKRFYFDFLKVLETQTHDTLPFMRTSAVTQVFYLLKDKAEQEQNLLRLLVNKLGDSDRGVASKASNHILSLLNVHPNMKNVVTNEVSNLVMRAPTGAHQDGKAMTNLHAQYFGILTLNQTMLTDSDEAVAKRLVSLYFALFEGILHEMDAQTGGKEEAPEIQKTGREKGRWRDGHKGKGMGIEAGRGKRKGKGKQGGKGAEKPSNTIADADSKVVAAILAGVRRALPFAKIEGAVIDKHMDTLFRITHCSTFNIALQALQLIFYACSAGQGGSGPSTSSGTQDRFYRALYASLLDPRLATTSKQAMYLNLLFKAMKSDHDDARTKAFVKRLTQLLGNSDPPLVCGSLYLIGELLTAKPGLRAMLNDAEDDETENYRDAVEDDNSSTEHESKNEGADEMFGAARTAGVKEHGYDGIKREPRFARAELTCLWEIVPLTLHFHPSVSLCASQLLGSQKISTSADLTLHTLSHFLDRFVYRNPKKNSATSKGASLMQPAVHASGDGGRVGLESGVVRLKGAGIRRDEYVNDAKFWRKKAVDVAPDQLFFHKYFNLRRQDAEQNEDKDRAIDSDKDASADESGEVDIASNEDLDASEEEDSAEEQEIWKAMKASMPREAGDEVLDEDEDGEDEESDIDPADMASSDEDISGSEGSDNDDGPGFEEDEEDLMPFSFDEDDDGSGSDDSKGKHDGRQKRKADDNTADEGDESSKPKSKSQKRRAEQKQRKAMPTFASADDYAHLLDDA